MKVDFELIKSLEGKGIEEMVESVKEKISTCSDVEYKEVLEGTLGMLYDIDRIAVTGNETQ